MESAIIVLAIGVIAMYCSRYANEPVKGLINIAGILIAAVGVIRLLFAVL